MIAHQRASTSVGWTDDRVELLKTLVKDGLSASQIARALGGVTRNAVIGKAHRLGCGPVGGGKASAPTRAKIIGTPRPAKPRSPKGVMVLAQQGGPTQRNPADNKVINMLANAEAREKPAPSVIERARAFLPLEGREPVRFGLPGCKWPVGGEGADMRCCGAERDDAKPYCADHAAVAFVKPPPGSRTGNQLIRSLRRWAA